MRQLIGAMKVSLDEKVEPREGPADWVDGWSDDYNLMPQIDACLLGAGMYPGYERYWTAIQNEPTKANAMTGTVPTPAEVEWARFASQTPHYVLSSTLTSATWPNTHFLRTPNDVAALKQQQGKDIYLVGGARTAASLIDLGLVDELRLIVYPLIAGEGTPLFAAAKHRRRLALRHLERHQDGRVTLIYRFQ
jgi:dihydrofolate reductase